MYRCWNSLIESEQYALLLQLKQLSSYVGNKYVTGLCSGIPSRMLLLIEYYFKEWPDFSGNHDYPVSVSNSKWSPEQQYYNAGLANTFWGKTPYGDKRRELCAFIFTQLTQLKENNDA